MKLVGLIFLCAAANAIDSEVHNIVDSNESNDTRKYYGLSFNHRCKSYQRVFKCMSACKAMNFQVYRIDQRCKCTCHETKTTTILPFFKWRTNGTTPAVPKTRSVRLYEIAGTMFPPPDTETEAKNETTNSTCPTFDFNTTSTPTLNSTENANSKETTTTTSTPTLNATENANSKETTTTAELTDSSDTESTISTDTESTISTVESSSDTAVPSTTEEFDEK